MQNHSGIKSVKSGEIGTPKGADKVNALHKINAVLGESIISFKDYLTSF